MKPLVTTMSPGFKPSATATKPPLVDVVTIVREGRISMTDAYVFEVGRNIVNTEGAVVPANALIGSTLQPEVYVVQDGIALRRTIVITATSGGLVAVAEGLKPGDIVVTSGFISLADGIPVRYR